MKVYVIKDDKGQYQTPDIDFISELWQADLFNDYEVAKCYCRSDCNVVECELIEKNELADHDKKVRAEVVAENQALKARWEKLKEWVKKYDWYECNAYATLSKMLELEEERFIFPTYDEFSTNKDSKFCFYKKGCKYILHNALPMFESIRINKLTENENIIIFEQPLTKMNYINACEYARKLFIGEE